MKALILFLILLPVLLVGATLYFLINKEDANPVTKAIEEPIMVAQDLLTNESNETSKNHSSPSLIDEKKVNDWNTSSLELSKEFNAEKLNNLKPESPDNNWTRDIKLALKNEPKKTKREIDDSSKQKSYKPVTKYYESGKKEMQGLLEDGRLFSAHVWKPNGELCPVSNLLMGNGVIVKYNPWGTQWYRQIYRKGFQISAKDRKKTIRATPSGNLSLRSKTLKKTDISSTLSSLGYYLAKQELNIELVWCSPGTFLMGSPEDEEGRGNDETLHEVKLTNGFLIARNVITQEQWQRIMGKNPSFNKVKKLPVNSISYEDAMLFCKKLNKVEKEAGRLPTRLDYKLPTEAQWEYACRISPEKIYDFGNDLNKKPESARAGKKAEARKIWEWCIDKHELFGSGKAIDPVCTNTESKYYVQRSGLFSEKGADVRPAERHHNLPNYKGKGNGMRVCITLPVDGIKMSDLENLTGFR